jgi:ferredoxin-NADP reductase
MAVYSIQVESRRWLTAHTFEIRFSRPPGLTLTPGQKISFLEHEIEHSIKREYTLINGPRDPQLALCVRHIAGGRFSPQLANAPHGRRFRISKPFGFFTFKDSSRPAVLVATGTGIAPFVAFARGGVRDFFLLHGVRTAEELYYGRLLHAAARSYIPCLSAEARVPERWPGAFCGRVSRYLETELAAGAYDFYLCGGSEMIRDATRIIDRRFEGSHLYTETFF